MSIFSASYEVPDDADARAIEVLTRDGLVVELSDEVWRDSIGTVIVVTTWSDDESAEAQRAFTERIDMLLSAAGISFRLREGGAGGKPGVNRRVLLDGRPVPLPTGQGAARFLSVYWTGDDDADIVLDALAVNMGVARDRLSIGPDDDPFLGLLEDE